MQHEAYIHTLNPFALHITGGFGIRWYGLSYLVGFVAAYLIILWFAKKGRAQITPSLVADYVFTAALGTVIGGRLGYCLFYRPELFLKISPEFPFWSALAVNEGGMASHGGIVGIILASLYFARKHKLSAAHLCDLTTLGGSIGVFFGRIANFVNGELVGRPAPEGYRWAVKFPQDIFLWPGQEPDRLRGLSPLAERLGVSQEVWLSWVARIQFDPESWRGVETTLARMVDAIQRGQAELASLIGPLLTARYPSQLFEALLEGALVFVVLFLIWVKPRKPGVITGWFLVVYSVVRVYGEQFRMPDAHLGFQMMGLTRGQILSFGMLLVGIIALIVAQMSKQPRLGGWLRSNKEVTQ